MVSVEMIPDRMAASSAESAGLRYVLVLVIIWGFTGIVAAAMLDASRSLGLGYWNPYADSVHPATLMIAGWLLPWALAKLLLLPFKGPGMWQFGPVAVIASWSVAWIAGVGLANMFWLGSTYDPRREVFALHITFGAALLFLGAYSGRREMPMAVAGGLLLLSSLGQWFVTETLSAPFFVACIGLSHVALACYYGGLLVRNYPPGLGFSPNVQRTSEGRWSGAGEAVTRNDSSQIPR